MLDWRLMGSSVPALMAGVELTLRLTGTVLLVAALLAGPVALLRNAASPWASGAARAYILFFRGTPALVQIALLYFGVAQFAFIRESWAWPVLREPFWCVVLALGLNGGAYTGQLWAAALRNVPTGAVEAARALGLSRPQVFRTVTVPLAARAALPAYANEVILTLKATALASSVTLLELTGRARVLVSETYAPYEIFLTAGGIYLALVFALTRLFGAMERALALPGLSATPPGRANRGAGPLPAGAPTALKDTA